MDTLKQFKIKDGINLYYIPAEKFKSVSVSMYIHRELSASEASKNALLCDVLSRGCRKYPDDITLERYLQDLYGAYFCADVARKGEDQLLCFTVKCLADRYAKNNVSQAINLLFDMVLDPYVSDEGFDKNYVKQEKINLINDIEALVNDKRSYAVLRLIQNMCKGENYSVHELGSKEDVLLIDEKNLFEHYKKVLKESPIDIFVVGCVDIDKVIDETIKLTKNLEPTNTKIPVCSPYKKEQEIIEITEEFDVTQAKLCIGFKTGISHKDDMYPALMVYNGILGSGAHSKLFNNVREKLSLAYYASSSLERYKGLMVISSGIEIKNKQKAIDEIFVQLDDIKNGKISEYEFTATKLSIINSLKSFTDEGAYLKDYYLGQIVGGTNVSLDELSEKILSVTKEDVVVVSKKIEPQMIYFLTGKGGAL